MNHEKVRKEMIKMMSTKLVALMGLVAVSALGFAISLSVPALAEEAMPDTQMPDAKMPDAQKPDAHVVGEASSPSRKVPIRVKFVDYQKAENGPGTLKLSGTGIGGSDVHIYVDGKRFAEVPVADGDGTWSVEDKIALDEAVHSVRVEQFDKTTNVVAGRAMFNMSLKPPSAKDLATPRPTAR